MAVEVQSREEVDAVTANEELIERISVAQAIAMFRLSLPPENAPEPEAISTGLKLAS
jgi:hypothetical protein